MWTDTTSYGQGQRGKKEPTTWSASVGELRVTVTCGHIGWDGKWIVNCHLINMSQVELVGCENKEEAILRAVVLVKDRLSFLHKLACSLAT